MVRIQATSRITGKAKVFIFSVDDYDKKDIHYPHWDFEEKTKTSNIFESII